jgi:hypothetical protein
MKFNDIQLLNSGKYSEEQLEQNIALRPYWENVRNQFCLRIPKDFDFLGLSKLNIKFGYFEGDSFEEPSLGGIAIYKRNDYSFNEFMALSEAEKNNKTLFYIEDSLSNLSDSFNLNDDVSEIIRIIANDIRDEGFEFKKTHKKSTKWHPSRKIKAVTELYFNKSGINSSLIITNKAGDILSKHTITGSKDWDFTWYHLWKGYWNENTFIIENKTGDKVIEVNAFSEESI